MQRKPRLSGFSLSPRTETTRSSSTSTTMPQKVGLQFIGHIVRTVRRVREVAGSAEVVIAPRLLSGQRDHIIGDAGTNWVTCPRRRRRPWAPSRRAPDRGGDA